MVELGLPLGPPAEGGAGRAATRHLHDSYILGELLGRGATSTVYKCLFKGKRECACKILKKSALDRRRVDNELPDLRELRHPNMVEIRDVFETADELTLVLELAEGAELLERIAERGFYSEQTAARAVRQILGALQCLHSRGHAHRALRPEKLVFASEAEEAPLKLLAVGLGVNHLLPTAPPYCAPEANKGEGAGPASDMWSLGVVAYILLCGFEPFASENGGSSSGQPGQGEPTEPLGHHALHFPGPWWDEVSDSAKDLVTQLLQVDPASRPTAEECLQHPWVRGDTPRTQHMDATVRSLREFNARRKFRAATQAVVATQRLVSPEKRLSRVLGPLGPPSPQEEAPAAPAAPPSVHDDKRGRC
ncbi:calcium/calmodulin-dependent protein kinase type IV-like isoform X2 [Thrips palmi]|nr:calcium/calmodulin-dependent protein kinase type IV-like isoform X2 [Thrips palmi]